LTDADAQRLQPRFDQVKAEWIAFARPAAPDLGRFRALKAGADEIIRSGRWVSGPDDLMSVLGRQRDEVMHSRVIAWLLRPTGRHGLGSRFLDAVVSHVWPDEEPLRSVLVTVETETTRSAADDAGEAREARADIVIYGDSSTIVIENKVDAGEGIDQCERLYWSWADQPTETRWLFLSPTGRAPVTATSAAARSAWRTISYAELRGLLEKVLAAAGEPAGHVGRSTARAYLNTLSMLATD
jgi:PD-(D/E)XK nuclease superfamily